MRNKIFISLLFVSVILLLVSLREIIYLVDQAKAIKDNRVIAHLVPLENHNKNSLSCRGEILVNLKETYIIVPLRGAHIIFYGKDAFQVEQYESLAKTKFILSFYDNSNKIIDSITMGAVRVTQIWYHSEEYFAISGGFLIPKNAHFLCLDIEEIDLSDFPPIKSVTFFAKDDEGKLAINIYIILFSIFAYACALSSIALSYLLFSMRVRKKREIGQLAEKKK